MFVLLDEEYKLRRSNWKRFLYNVLNIKPMLSNAITVSSGVATLNIQGGLNYSITLTENTTLTLSNLRDGDEGKIIVTQAAGNYTLDILPQPKVINGDGSGDLTITDGAGNITILCYSYNGSVLYMNYATYK
jgi:hypothetical protein